ncbi:hypothetical protein C0Q70_18768 [Pomacea canaliculata]|uniref:Uncharacterized protein n=1 Tax=Pomacea canaliculata TaxID=400727 RepID=A0A2T7NHF8_POMCA|nr:hypothetical protein C0Q70_18768 [Pomacea canaliculata]
MSKRRNVQFVRDEPSFIRQFKEKIGYKEGPTVDTKRQKLEFNNSDDDDSPEKEDEKPVVVVLQSGDLTAEEVEKLQKIQEDEEAISDKKIKFKKPVRKGDNAEEAESVEKTKETQGKGKQKKEKKKKDKPNFSPSYGTPVQMDKVHDPPVMPVRIAYTNLMDMKKDLTHLPPKRITVKNSEDAVVLGLSSKTEEVYVKVSFSATTGLQANVSVFQIPALWFARDIEMVRLKIFLKELGEKTLCAAVTETDLQPLAQIKITDKKYFRHITYVYENGKLCSYSRVRATTCSLLVNTAEATCKDCLLVKKTLYKKKSRQEARCQEAIRPNDPLQGIPYDKLKEAFKEIRKDKSRLEKDVAQFQEHLKQECMDIDLDISDSLKEINCLDIAEPLQHLFWEEQKKAFAAEGHGHRWHPVILRFAILLHIESKAVYETLTKTGLLKLPGSSTLREYTHVHEASSGFQPEIAEELTKATVKLELNQRFVTLLHDKMSIKADLVIDKRSGKLVGFVNKDMWQFDFIYMPHKLATQALVFYVVGINSHLNMSIGFFGTWSTTADVLYPLFWQAVGVIEGCGLKAIVSTCNKAPPNQRFQQLHCDADEICY